MNLHVQIPVKHVQQLLETNLNTHSINIVFNKTTACMFVSVDQDHKVVKLNNLYVFYNLVGHTINCNRNHYLHHHYTFDKTIQNHIYHQCSETYLHIYPNDHALSIMDSMLDIQDCLQNDIISPGLNTSNLPPKYNKYEIPTSIFNHYDNIDPLELLYKFKQQMLPNINSKIYHRILTFMALAGDVYYIKTNLHNVTRFHSIFENSSMDIRIQHHREFNDRSPGLKPLIGTRIPPIDNSNSNENHPPSSINASGHTAVSSSHNSPPLDTFSGTPRDKSYFHSSDIKNNDSHINNKFKDKGMVSELILNLDMELQPTLRVKHLKKIIYELNLYPRQYTCTKLFGSVLYFIAFNKTKDSPTCVDFIINCHDVGTIIH